MKLLIVSGLSGSGKSVALHTLEDLDYYCIDNLPVALLEPFAQQLLDNPPVEQDNAAVGIDARTPSDDLQRFPQLLRRLRERGIQCEILFLQANDETLLKRFSETRRKHPLSKGNVSLADAIRQERNLLEPISANASLHIDTTHTNVHQLRDLVQERVGAKTSSTVFQRTPISCSTCAVCPTRTGMRACGRRPGWTRRSPRISTTSRWSTRCTPRSATFSIPGSRASRARTAAI